MSMEYLIKLFACWVIQKTFVVCRFVVQKYLFSKILSGIPSECQTVWIQSHDVLSSLVQVETVFKACEQTLEVVSGMQRGNVNF